MGGVERRRQTASASEPVSGRVTRQTWAGGNASGSSRVASSRVGAPLKRKGSRSFFIRSLAFSSARSRFRNLKYDTCWSYRLGHRRILDWHGLSANLAGVGDVRLGDNLSFTAKTNACQLQSQYRKAHRVDGRNVRTNGREFFQTYGHIHWVQSYGMHFDLNFRQGID